MGVKGGCQVGGEWIKVEAEGMLHEVAVEISTARINPYDTD